MSRFVEIARTANLPTFVEIFENRLKPNEEIELQDFSALKQLLRRIVENFHPTQLTRGKIALACLLCPEAKLNVVERRLREYLAEADRALDAAAAELVRGRDPEVDRKRVRFLQTRDIEDWFDFSKAYDQCRAAKLSEAQSKGLKEKPILDMFAIQVDTDGPDFELTEDTVVFEEEEPPIPDDFQEEGLPRESAEAEGREEPSNSGPSDEKSRDDIARRDDGKD